MTWSKLAVLSCALFAILSACTGPSRTDAPVIVYAAASVRDVMTDLARLYQDETGTRIVVNFGSSATLASQALFGGQADVFLSADDSEMDRLDAAGLLLAGSRRPFLSNRLVVIVPTDGDRVRPTSAADLAAPAIVRIALGDPDSVPAGRYAKRWLQHNGLWNAVAPKVIPAVDVRAALAAVESGSVEAGIVYRTDARASTTVTTAFEVIDTASPMITYPIAILKTKRQVPAEALVEWLARPQARSRFEVAGFIVR